MKTISTSKFNYSLQLPGVNQLPPILYKYRDWRLDQHKRIITNSELFASAPKSFNDPFDSEVPIIAKFKEYSNRELKEMLKKTFPKDGKYNYKQCIRDPKFMDFYYSQIRTELKNFEKEKCISLEKIAEETGIMSFSAINNNILLWSHYSNCHQGLCIGFDTNNLTKYFDGNQPFQVYYYNEYPIIIIDSDPWKEFFYVDVINAMIHLFITKSKSWEYEKEIRFVLLGTPNSIHQIPEECYKEFILGFKMDNESKTEITKIVRHKYPSATIYQAVKSFNRFEIDLELIS